MPGRCKITVSPRASRQLITHVEFLSRKSVNAAIKLSAAYKEAIQQLKENPLQFPVDPRSEMPDPPRAALFGKRYQIYFDIEGDTVFVGAVRDCRQNPDKS